MKRQIMIVSAVIYAVAVAAQVKLSNVFGNHMVLQQEKPLCVWGTATPGTEVKVCIGRKNVKTVTEDDGRWRVSFAPLKASAKPVRFVVTGDGGRVELSDVLVGEVWLASGQSNMEYSMANNSNIRKPLRGDPDRLLHEYEKADNPLIRLLYVRKDLRKDTLPTTGWQRLNRESLKPFSAAAYFFAKALQDSLNVPVGVISSSWGGTSVETWTPAEQYHESPVFADKMDGDKLSTNGENVGLRWSKMIEPMVPMALRGMLWYQGESNLISGDTDIYTEKMRLLVDGWRKAWGDSLLPMYYVQISPLRYSARKSDPLAKTWQDLPRFWDAQARCSNVIPNVAMVVTTDIPDNLNDIHPSYKWVVGERLAGLALHDTYGRTDIICRGPEMRSVSVIGDSIVVEFNNVGKGLATRDGKAPDWFYALMSNNRYSPVEAVLVGNRVLIPVKGMAKNTVLRFGWDEIAQPNLVNSAGLPAVPFSQKVTIGH